MSDFDLALDGIETGLARRRRRSRAPRTPRTLGATVFAAWLLGACAAGGNDLVSDRSRVAASVSGVGHYGSMIGIPGFSVDGFSAGNAMGWGGGGGSACCVMLPARVTTPVMVTVKWETYRSAVEEERHHEARVPVHFTVEPGKSSGLYVHFFPGHTVEVWSAFPLPASTAYPGPKYPTGPAPDYVPLPDEKPAPTGTAGRSDGSSGRREP